MSNEQEPAAANDPAAESQSPETEQPETADDRSFAPEAVPMSEYQQIVFQRYTEVQKLLSHAAIQSHNFNIELKKVRDPNEFAARRLTLHSHILDTLDDIHRKLAGLADTPPETSDRPSGIVIAQPKIQVVKR